MNFTFLTGACNGTVRASLAYVGAIRIATPLCKRENIREGDVVLTVGAGDIFRAGEALLSE